MPAAGITPACAGKRQESKPDGSGGKDHPRVCGEKIGTVRRDVAFLGSPPRVRGKVHQGGILQNLPGITPACAGKSVIEPCFWDESGDHPRVCGEKLKTPTIKAARLGSPPRVRGKEQKAQTNQAYMGITPACAGKS